MVFCSFCGKELPVEAGFCPSCGKPTTSSTTGSVTSQSQATQTGMRPNLASEGDRTVAVIPSTILIFVISLAIFLPRSLFIGFFGAFGSFPSFFFGPVTLITWLFWLLYFTYFESTMGQTLGKQVMKIRVVDETTMQDLDFGMSLVRNILRIIDWLPLFYLIGFLLIATNQKKQRIGDMVARSIVVRIYRQFMFQTYGMISIEESPLLMPLSAPSPMEKVHQEIWQLLIRIQNMCSTRRFLYVLMRLGYRQTEAIAPGATESGEKGEQVRETTKRWQASYGLDCRGA